MQAPLLSRARWIAIAFLVAALAACSRADNGDVLTDLQREDQSASASSTGLVTFASTQISQATNETGEPRPIAGITPPADETSEPFPLI